MNKQFSIYLVVILFAFVFNGCEKDDDTDPFYPTIVGAKSKGEIESLINVVKKTGIYGCSVFDDFGHFRLNLKDKDQCTYNLIGKSVYTKDELNLMVKKSLVELNQFTEVDDTALLQIDFIRTLKGESYDAFMVTYPDSFPPVWRVVYKPQLNNDLLVRGTIIEAFIDSAGVFAISGNWFRSIYFPTEDKITVDDAKNRLLNTKLTYKTYTLPINNETQWRNAYRVVVPVYRSGKIEIRVCHALYTDTWEVIIDTQSGEQLSTVNLAAI
jgi:hypothetical protein